MLLTIFWSSFLKTKNNQNKKIFIVIVSLLMILLSGLRDISVGADTWNYENHFYELINMDYYSWKNLFSRIFLLGDYDSRDLGYEFATKLFATFIPNFRIYLFAVAIFVCYGLGRFLYKHSENICLSYVIFQSFLLQFFLFTAIRQTIAVCLLVCWGYDLILEKKPVKYLLLCVIAMTFHTTAIIMLPFYFICNHKYIRIKKNSASKYIVAVVLTLIFLLFRQVIFEYMPMGLYSGYRKSSGIGQYDFIILMCLIVVVTGILDVSHCLRIKEQKDINIINATIISEIIIASSVVLDILFRLGYYYIFFMLCHLPLLMKSLDVKSAKVVKCLIYAVLFLYVLRPSEPYKFCF